MSKLRKLAAGKDCMMRELWLPVHGFEGLYEVSSLGRVRVLERKIAMRWFGKFRVQKERILSNKATGYRRVALTKYGIETTHLVHRLVAIAFVPGSGAHVRHLDGNDKNNRKDNLAWGSCADNEHDKLLHGRRMFGESHARSKYKLATIKEIKVRGAAGEPHKSIAAALGVNKSTVHMVLANKQWRSA